jgi:MoxR-like ATPase
MNPANEVIPFRLYTGVAHAEQPAAPATLPHPIQDDLSDPRGYEAGEELSDAVNVALLLGQPLLLTGEPGTGKTQLATSLARELGLGTALRFETRSTSVANDLFYYFNALAQYLEVQKYAARVAAGTISATDGEPKALAGRNFIMYNALGEAILRALPYDEVRHLLPDGFAHQGAPRRSVVLVDEIDKAHHDFPNDLLARFEGDYRFDIPELGARLAAPPELRPVLVVTSNSDKSLPEAFLRRCVFYNIAFPTHDMLVKIVKGRLKWLEATADSQGFLGSALDLFEAVRAVDTLSRKPGTAELLGWLLALRPFFPDLGESIETQPIRLQRAVGCLVKTVEDVDVVKGITQEWVRNRA